MNGIVLRECKKAGPKFLCSGTKFTLDIHLHVFYPPPPIAGIAFREWSTHTCHKYYGVPSDNYYRISD